MSEIPESAQSSDRSRSASSKLVAAWVNISLFGVVCSLLSPLEKPDESLPTSLSMST